MISLKYILNEAKVQNLAGLHRFHAGDMKGGMDPHGPGKQEVYRIRVDDL